MITADAERGAAISLEGNLDLERPTSDVKSAVLLSTAHGVYEAQINGMPVSTAVLSPGWSPYHLRLPWQEHEVTSLVRAGGPHVQVSAVVGNGWYRGDLGPWHQMNYGEDLGLIAALTVAFVDGHVQTLVTSSSWRGWSTPILENSLYHGQRTDARLRETRTVRAVREIGFDQAVLVPHVGPPVVRQEAIRPHRTWVTAAGSVIIDFGQNLVGWLRFTLKGARGAEIVVRHAEALEGGALAVAALRSARATDSMILSGEVDLFEPTFTFHGFRYAEVTGLPGGRVPEDLEAVVVGSDIRRTGTFECSEPRINQLVHNSVWGQKGNFLSIPTDCPQRDERLGWTGDIAVYASTAAYQFDVADFLHGWLMDLAEEQRNNDGCVPWVVPDLMGVPDPQWNQLAAVWGDAAVWVPEALWHAYGDADRLAQYYPAMVTHLESVEARVSPNGLWDVGFQFGDWLDPDAPPDDAQRAKADPGVVATACLYRSSRFAAEAAHVLNRDEERDRWTALAQRTKCAFNTHYVREGRVHSDCATVYALALHFGLLDDSDRPWAAARLADLIREAEYRATTGFAGTAFVTWALSENGYGEDAYRLILQDKCPSWLYQVEMGATTMWERWDSVLPDGRLNDPIMTSLNHYALGAVCDWLYRAVAGIRAASPGYRRIQIKPLPGPGIDWVKATYESVVGPIHVEWVLDDVTFRVCASVPDGVPTEILLPDGTSMEAEGGTHELEIPRASIPGLG